MSDEFGALWGPQVINLGPEASIELAVLRLPRHPPGLGAALVRRTARRGDAQHPHRLEAQREALAAVGRAHVEPGQLPDAVQAVADRVAVGEELLRRVRHAPV